MSKFWSCYIWHNHDWTCAAAEGIPATPKQISEGMIGFLDYAKMYCKKCGKESENSLLARAKVEHERNAANGH